MKILFLSHYRHSNYFSNIAKKMLLSLYSTNINLVCRHIETSEPTIFGDLDLISSLEKVPLDECTHCIQFLHPEYIVASKAFKKNIAIVDTNDIASNYIYNLNLVDEVLCFTQETKRLLIPDVNITITVIPPPLTDLSSQLSFLYENADNFSIDDLSIMKFSKNMKEILSA